MKTLVILRKFEIKVGDLENVSISENSLKQAGINTAPESIESYTPYQSR
jgi:hypothetical protein